MQSTTPSAALHRETIAALATARGYGGVGIIRVSGDAVLQVAAQLLHTVPKPRYAHYTPFYDAAGAIIDQGIALYFPAPHSFTGEAVLELQGHGGPIVLDQLLATVLQVTGVRAARAGEFSERAFLNGKMDLLQAEAVADLIAATSREAARSALRSLQGAFSATINALIEQLTALRINVEAAIDFSDEPIDLLSEGRVAEQITALQQQLNQVLRSAVQGQLLREGMSVVIAGQPNAGKSSLLNRLAESERAIVTDIAGTTRDLIRQEIQIDGMPLHIIDTAGLRESGDPIEQEGIRRTWQAIDSCDQLLLLIDAKDPFSAADEAILAQLPPQLATTIIFNKMDTVTKLPPPHPHYPTLYLSAKSGQGLEGLRAHLKEVMGFQGDSEGIFMARRRHLEALQRAATALSASQTQQQQGSTELVAEELRLAQQALGTITGAVTADDLLGEIFSHFCIGK